MLRFHKRILPSRSMSLSDKACVSVTWHTIMIILQTYLLKYKQYTQGFYTCATLKRILDCSSIILEPFQHVCGFSHDFQGHTDARRFETSANPKRHSTSRSIWLVACNEENEHCGLFDIWKPKYACTFLERWSMRVHAAHSYRMQMRLSKCTKKKR